MPEDLKTTDRALEQAEDIIAVALAEGIQFGVRCGCQDCDAKVRSVLLMVKETLQ